MLLYWLKLTIYQYIDDKKKFKNNKTLKVKSRYVQIYGRNMIHHLYLHFATTIKGRGRRGRDRMVVEFITTYAISAYHH